MKLLFISDIHLGDGSAADDFGKNDREFINWLESIGFDELYILGDMEELWQFKLRRIKRAHRLIYDYLKEKNVYRVIGNHDYKILGKNTIDITIDNGSKLLISHGHQFDKRMNKPILRGFVWCLGLIERIPFMKWVDNPDTFSKKKSKTDIMTEDYVKSQLKKGYDVVVCGHTHKEKINTLNGIFPDYVNCGTCIHGKFTGQLLDTNLGKFTTVRYKV